MKPGCGQSAFTLVELIIAITLLAAVVATAYTCLTVATRAWRVGVETADAVRYGDYAIGNIVAGLSSAYYPENVPQGENGGDYGMVLTNDGDGEDAGDTLTWVKLGSALIGRDSPEANTPHKISLFRVRKGEAKDEAMKEGGLAVKTWRLTALPEDFDAENEEFVKPRIIVPGVTGLDFRVLNPKDNMESGKLPRVEEESDLEIDDEERWWDEDWTDDYTNHLPYQVEITLYMEPPEERAEPIAVRRIATLRCAPLSWPDKFKRGGSSGKGGQSGKGNQPGKGGQADKKDRVVPNNEKRKEPKP